MKMRKFYIGILCSILSINIVAQNVYAKEWIINPQFDLAFNFDLGVALVCLDGKCGAVDYTGNIVIPIIYSSKSSKLAVNSVDSILSIHGINFPSTALSSILTKSTLDEIISIINS